MVNIAPFLREGIEMAPPQLARRESSPRPPARSYATLWAFLLGVPLTVGVLYAVEQGPLSGVGLAHYVQHDVERVEVLLFCVAFGALVAKVLAYLIGERAALRAQLLPPWDGKCVGVSQAGPLRDGLRGLGRRLQRTYLVRRAAAVLDFLRSRGSSNDLDDQLRGLADTDSITLENSYALIRLITWAVPILGFLGTVLGITGAISNVTPQQLENNMGAVTGGLALAFDATAVGLSLTMLLMFLTFLVERLEQGVLEAVDRYADEQLAHRFERTGPEGDEFVEVVRSHTDVLVQATGQLVERQAEVWARALGEAEQHWAEAGVQQQARLTAALEAALQRSLDSHQQRLDELEQRALERYAAVLNHISEVAQSVRDTGREQQAALAQAAQGVVAQAEALAQLQQNEGQLVRLQEALYRNLEALAGAGAFEQAVHSLTAAIHLLTARAGAVPAAGAPPRVGPRPGAAA
jgi:biopolymer transport protein ExbB/TolQ